MTGNRLENSRKREGDGLKLMCLFAAAGAQQHSWWVNAILSPQCRKRYSGYSLSPAIKIANDQTRPQVIVTFFSCSVSEDHTRLQRRI